MSTRTDDIKKRDARSAAEQIAKSLPVSYLTESDERIFERLIDMPEYREAKRIFCYVSTDNEPDTRRFISKAFADGKEVCVPKCYDGSLMRAYYVSSLDDLIPGFMGILEPEGTGQEADKKDIDFGVIPCVSCNRSGQRIGHGRGYYDSFLRDSDFDCVVLCRERVMMDDIPTDGLDVRVPAVLTEKGLYRND